MPEKKTDGAGAFVIILIEKNSRDYFRRAFERDKEEICVTQSVTFLTKKLKEIIFG